MQRYPHCGPSLQLWQPEHAAWRLRHKCVRCWAAPWGFADASFVSLVSVLQMSLTNIRAPASLPDGWFILVDPYGNVAPKAVYNSEYAFGGYCMSASVQALYSGTYTIYEGCSRPSAEVGPCSGTVEYLKGAVNPVPPAPPAPTAPATPPSGPGLCTPYDNSDYTARLTSSQLPPSLQLYRSLFTKCRVWVPANTQLQIGNLQTAKGGLPGAACGGGASLRFSASRHLLPSCCSVV